MPKEETDDLLRSFLEREAEDRTRGFTAEQCQRSLLSLSSLVAENQKASDVRITALSQQMFQNQGEIARQFSLLGERVSGVEARVKLEEFRGERHDSDIKALRIKTQEVEDDARISAHEFTEQELKNAHDAVKNAHEAEDRRKERVWSLLVGSFLVILAALLTAALEESCHAKKHELELPHGAETTKEVRP